MRTALRRNIFLNCSMALLTIFFTSCASDPESTQASEAVTASNNGENNQAGEAPANTENTENTADGAAEELVSQNKENGAENSAAKEGNALEKSTEEMIGNIAKDEKNAALTEVKTNAAAPVEAPKAVENHVQAPATASVDQSQSGQNSQRAVRFVVSNETPVYDKPNGSVVTNLAKGDPLVVLEEGEWSQITENRFIMTSALSKNIIPRDVNMTNTWQGDKPGS